MSEKSTYKDREQRIQLPEDATLEVRRVQDALRESEEKFRVLADSTPAAVVLYQDDRLIFVNRAAETITGYCAEELLQMNFWDIVHPDYKALVQERGRMRQRGEETADRYELKIITKDGTEKWVDLNGASMMIGGRPAAIISIADITERKQTLKALKASEERFRSLFDNAVEGVFRTTLGGRIVDANMAYAKMFGYESPEDAVNSVTDIAHQMYADPDDRRRALGFLTEKGYLNNFECRMRRRNGAIFWVVMNGRLAYFPDGTPCLEGFIVDITDRKQAEEALKESEERFRITSLTTSDAIWNWNIKEGKVEWFGEIDTMLGYNSGEFPRTLDAWEKAVHPDDHDRVMAALEQHLHMQTPYDEEYRVVQKNGNLRYWTERGIALYDEKGNAFSMIGACTDITERVQAEMDRERLLAELSTERALWRATVENMLDPVATCDAQGGTFYMNPSFEKLLVRPIRADLDVDAHPEYYQLYRPDGTLFPPEELPLQKAIRTGENVRNIELVQRSSGGREFTVIFSAAPLRDADGKITGAVAVGHDITEVKRAEEALRKAHDELELRVQERTVQLNEAYKSLQHETEERKRVEEQLRQRQKLEALGTLAGGIAHDFNNILAGIMGFAEMVREDMAPDSPEYHRLELVLKGAHRGRDLVRQILTFSRQTEHEQKSVALSDIVKEGLKLLRPLLPSTIEIRSKCLTGDDTILADSAQIHQVLMNLCTNGAQAMGKKGGILEISVTRDHFRKNDHMPVPGMKPGNYATLTVRDTGPGMKPEVIERIFDPFFTTKAHTEGTGLGLSVVHGIVKSHGGFIRVESEPGKGSAFYVYLPKTERQEALIVGEEVPVKGGKERILFVDDEDLNVELNNERLTRLGYEVVATTSSLEALEIFKKEPRRFHLVITDYTMPQMTGLDLARELLKVRNDIPIILCTGYNDSVSSDKAKRAGIREFLLKPHGKSELERAIRRVLDAKTER
ncbi:MAG: two component system sensor histidine kinase, hybrid [Deltaproteobacteria bacterium]|nr:two component system sensor histidine kinase, hybrid [Deltaproteobacteria bacterium]